jgi:diguanylate cyclase (GGDEF)-like protein
VRDITERKLAEQKIAHLAHHDYLTNLPNRALFLDRLDQALSLAKRGHYKSAVLFLDLDGFKAINDTLGHDAGDLLLQVVAQRLKPLVRDSDTVARIGGDEFTFVLNDIGSCDAVAAVAQKIITALAEPFALPHGKCQVGGSIGVALFPDDSTDAEALLRMADEAMYVAKQNGKNTYCVHQDLAKGRPTAKPAAD